MQEKDKESTAAAATTAVKKDETNKENQAPGLNAAALAPNPVDLGVKPKKGEEEKEVKKKDPSVLKDEPKTEKKEEEEENWQMEAMKEMGGLMKDLVTAVEKKGLSALSETKVGQKLGITGDTLEEAMHKKADPLFEKGKQVMADTLNVMADKLLGKKDEVKPPEPAAPAPNKVAKESIKELGNVEREEDVKNPMMGSLSPEQLQEDEELEQEFDDVAKVEEMSQGTTWRPFAAAVDKAENVLDDKSRPEVETAVKPNTAGPRMGNKGEDS